MTQGKIPKLTFSRIEYEGICAKCFICLDGALVGEFYKERSERKSEQPWGDWWFIPYGIDKFRPYFIDDFCNDPWKNWGKDIKDTKATLRFYLRHKQEKTNE